MPIGFPSPQSNEAVLRRTVSPETGELPARPPIDLMPDLRLVDLSWAGRLRDGHPSLAAIAIAQVGDRITLNDEGRFWSIRDASGNTLGRMSQAFAAPEGLAFQRGEIGAIIHWRMTDNKEEFRRAIRREAWEAVLPQLTFGSAR